MTRSAACVHGSDTKQSGVRVVVEDADVTVYAGDALSVLEGLDRVDAIVSSPPYLDARPEYGHPTAQWWDDFFALASTKVAGPVLLNVGRIWRDGEETDWWMQLRGYARANGWLHYDTLLWLKPNGNPIQGKLFANRHEIVLCLGLPGCEFNTDELRVPYAPASIPRLRRGWTNHIGVKNDIRKNGNRSTEPHPAGGRPPSYVVHPTGREKGNPHPAPMALGLAEDLVRLAAWPGQVVFDPFAGSGTTAIAARKHGRRAVLAEINPEYATLAAARLSQQVIAA
jgi:DNA modification methylase